MPETPCSSSCCSSCCCCVCLAGLGRRRLDVVLQFSLQVAGLAPPATRSPGRLAQTAAEAQHERLQGLWQRSCPWACTSRSKGVNTLLGCRHWGHQLGWLFGLQRKGLGAMVTLLSACTAYQTRGKVDHAVWPC